MKSFKCLALEKAFPYFVGETFKEREDPFVMSKTAKDLAWVEAKKKYHLSAATVQMARALGLNPNKLGSLANHTQEPWKEPFSDFIRTLYERRFKLGELS